MIRTPFYIYGSIFKVMTADAVLGRTGPFYSCGQEVRALLAAAAGISNKPEASGLHFHIQISPLKLAGYRLPGILAPRVRTYLG
jgi:hypothetical protein